MSDSLAVRRALTQIRQFGVAETATETHTTYRERTVIEQVETIRGGKPVTFPRERTVRTPVSRSRRVRQYDLGIAVAASDPELGLWLMVLALCLMVEHPEIMGWEEPRRRQYPQEGCFDISLGVHRLREFLQQHRIVWEERSEWNFRCLVEKRLEEVSGVLVSYWVVTEPHPDGGSIDTHLCRLRQEGRDLVTAMNRRRATIDHLVKSYR